MEEYRAEWEREAAEVAVPAAEEITSEHCMRQGEGSREIERRRLGRYVTMRFNTRSSYLQKHLVKRHK